jgi:signal transduction histidine kinase
MSLVQQTCCSDGVPRGAIAVTPRQQPSGIASVGKLVASDRTGRASASAAPEAAGALIAGGRALVHAGLRALLEARRRISLAGEAEARDEPVVLVRRIRPVVRLTDARLPGLDRIEATGRICAAAVFALVLLTKTRVKAFNERLNTATISNTASRAPDGPRARLVAEADEMRRRIERDLHDGCQQRLVTLALELQAVKDAVPSERPDLVAQLTHIEDGLRAALGELREIAHGVHPAVLSEGGLRPALKSLARRSALPMELELGPVQRLPEPVEVAVYYVVSEALTNTVKHAHASEIHVGLREVDRALHLRVRDDGDGGADPTRGSGLVGLKDRIETLGGTIAIQSPAGAGTSLHVELPLAQ